MAMFRVNSRIMLSHIPKVMLCESEKPSSRMCSWCSKNTLLMIQVSRQILEVHIKLISWMEWKKLIVFHQFCCFFSIAYTGSPAHHSDLWFSKRTSQFHRYQLRVHSNQLFTRQAYQFLWYLLPFRFRQIKPNLSARGFIKMYLVLSTFHFIQIEILIWNHVMFSTSAFYGWWMRWCTYFQFVQYNIFGEKKRKKRIHK